MLGLLATSHGPFEASDQDEDLKGDFENRVRPRAKGTTESHTGIREHPHCEKLERRDK